MLTYTGKKMDVLFVPRQKLDSITIHDRNTKPQSLKCWPVYTVQEARAHESGEVLQDNK